VEGRYGEYNFQWTISFGHDNHFHPVNSNLAGSEVEMIVPSSGHTFTGSTFFRFEVVFTDEVGLFTTE